MKWFVYGLVLIVGVLVNLYVIPLNKDFTYLWGIIIGCLLTNVLEYFDK